MPGFLYSALASAGLLSFLLIGLAFASLVAVHPVTIRSRTFAWLLVFCGLPFWFAVHGPSTSGSVLFAVLSAQLLVLGLMRKSTVYFFGTKETALQHAMDQAAASLQISSSSGSEASGGRLTHLGQSADDVVVRVRFSPLLGIGRVEIRPHSERHMLPGLIHESRRSLVGKDVRSPRSGILQLGVGGVLMLSCLVLVAGLVVLPAVKRHPWIVDGPLSARGGSTTDGTDGGGPRSKSTWIGKPAPSFELQTLSGNTIRLDEVVGEQVVILNFFATWCEPCKREMPELVRFHEAYSGSPLLFIGVDAKESRKKVEKFRDTYKVPYPIGIDDGEIMDAYGVNAYPTSIVIGLDGTIQDYLVGMVSDADRAFGSFMEAGELLTLAGTSDSASAPNSSRPSRQAGLSTTPLLSYSFEDLDAPFSEDNVSMARDVIGPPGVGIQHAYRVSGYGAIEIEDAPGNGGFPELLGTFPVSQEGVTYLHFELLTITPKEEMHVALAGPKWFGVTKDGIGFWLTAKNGSLSHTTGGRPERLMDIKPYTWYFFDVAYDVAAGTYDLRIREEGKSRPVVDLKRRMNASSAAGSRIDKVSFIGDHPDRGAAHYFVDDVVVTNDESITEFPFGEPKRRTLFCGQIRDLQVASEGTECPPVARFKDFGELTGSRRMEAIGLYRQACELLDEGGRPFASVAMFDAATSLSNSSQSSGLSGKGNLSHLGSAVAMAHHGEFEDAETRLSAWRDQNPADLRYIGVRARIAELALARGSASSATSSVRSRPDSEASFYRRLWASDFSGAQTVANRALQTSSLSNVERVHWLERFGDAAFCAGDLSDARSAYEKALASGESDHLILPKLLDLHHQEGDFVSARLVRQLYADAQPGGESE